MAKKIIEAYSQSTDLHSKYSSKYRHLTSSSHLVYCRKELLNLSQFALSSSETKTGQHH